MPTPSVIKFVNWISGTVLAFEDAMATALGLPLPSNLNTALTAAVNSIVTLPSVFGASGPSHSTGLVPDPGSVAGTTRVLLENATFGLAPAKVVLQAFSGNGTYTPTPGMQMCLVIATGSGGGGGGVAGVINGSNGGGGGSAGATAISLLTAAQIGVSQAVTVPAGGAGGAAGNNNGTAGSATSLGSLVVANGGLAGTAANGINTVGAGNDGGSGGTGQIVITGGGSGTGVYTTTNTTISTPGYGGASWWGGGGRVPAYGSGATTAGTFGQAYGSGGSGAGFNNISANAAGGTGQQGVLFILEFIT